MSLYTFPNSTEGLDQVGIQLVTEVPSLSPLILLFTFFVVLLGGVGRQIARTGSADYPMWSTVASIATLIIALLMSIISGFIRLDWLVIIVVITIFSGIWLFLERRSGEI